MAKLGLIEVKHEVLGTNQRIPHVAASTRCLVLDTPNDASGTWREGVERGRRWASRKSRPEPCGSLEKHK